MEKQDKKMKRYSQKMEVSMHTQKNPANRWHLVSTTVAILLMMAGTGMVYGFQSRIQWSESALYAETERVMDRAFELNADILSPTSFGKAMRSAEKAESDYVQGKKLPEIRKQLHTAIT